MELFSRKYALIGVVVIAIFCALWLILDGGRESTRLTQVKRTEPAQVEVPGSSLENEDQSGTLKSSSSLRNTKDLQERKDHLNTEVLELDALIEKEWARIAITHPEVKRLRETLANYYNWNSEQRRISSRSFGIAQTWFQQEKNVLPMSEYYKVILTETYRDLTKDGRFKMLANIQRMETACLI